MILRRVVIPLARANARSSPRPAKLPREAAPCGASFTRAKSIRTSERIVPERRHENVVIGRDCAAIARNGVEGFALDVFILGADSDPTVVSLVHGSPETEGSRPDLLVDCGTVGRTRSRE